MGPGSSAWWKKMAPGGTKMMTGATWAKRRAAALKGDIMKQLVTRGLCVPWKCTAEKLTSLGKRHRKRAAAIATLCLSDQQLDFIQGNSLEEIGVGIEEFYRVMEVKERLRIRRILRGTCMRRGESVERHIEKVGRMIADLKDLGDVLDDEERGMVLLETVSLDNQCALNFADQPITWAAAVSAVLRNRVCADMESCKVFGDVRGNEGKRSSCHAQVCKELMWKPHGVGNG
jgi:hypothetical protein